MRAHAAGVEVGVACRRVDGVLFKVFADVLCGGLRQQAVNTLPEEEQGKGTATVRFKILKLQSSITESNSRHKTQISTFNFIVLKCPDCISELMTTNTVTSYWLVIMRLFIFMSHGIPTQIRSHADGEL